MSQGLLPNGVSISPPLPGSLELSAIQSRADRLLGEMDLSGPQYDFGANFRAGMALTDALTARVAATEVVRGLEIDQVEDFAVGFAYRRALVSLRGEKQ